MSTVELVRNGHVMEGDRRGVESSNGSRSNGSRRPGARDRVIGRKNGKGSKPSVVFAQLAEVHFLVTAPEIPETLREEHRDRLQRLTAQFESRHGAIIDEYYCSGTGAGAVLTDRYEIHRVGPHVTDQTIEVVQLLLQCDWVAIRAMRNLPLKDRNKCVHLVYGVVKSLLSLVDDSTPVQEKRRGEKSLTVLEGELGHAREYYDELVQRKARFRYLAGMIPTGLLFLPVLGFSLVGILMKADPSVTEFDLGVGAACFIAGGFGAIISVMIRASSGRLRLQPGMGNQLMVLGAFRPIIGAVFGVAFYVLMKGGLLPIAIPDDVSVQAYFYPGIAFLAGFSERLAQDTLKRTGDRLGGTLAEGSVGPPASGAPPATNAS